MGNSIYYSSVPYESVQNGSVPSESVQNGSVPYVSVQNGSVPSESVSTDPVQNESTTHAETSMITNTSTTNVPQVSIKKKSDYVHPFIQMIDKYSSESEMINTLEAFCGKTQIGTDQNGQPIYEVIDQMEFFAPVLQVFSYCANNGKKSVVQWLMNNFVPLQVSYDNNFCYFECLKFNHHDIIDMIVSHESFIPSMEILENLISRNKYAHFRTCMASSHLRDDLSTYRFTFMHYIDNNQYNNVNNLFNLIKQRITNKTIEISDQIYPNPKFVQLQQPVPVEQTPLQTEMIETVQIINQLGDMDASDVIIVQQSETHSDSVQT